jgi:hypothetical protein
MMTPAEIVALVRQAFAGTVRRGGLSLREADVLRRQGTAYEKAKARVLDDDLEWKQVPFEDLQQFPVLSFLDPVGFRYYLPAFMVWVLTEAERIDPTVLVTLLSALARTERKGAQADSQYALLDKQQSETVALFLEYVMEHHPDEAVWSLAQEALESYWQQFFFRQ